MKFFTLFQSSRSCPSKLRKGARALEKCREIGKTCEKTATKKKKKKKKVNERPQASKSSKKRRGGFEKNVWILVEIATIFPGSRLFFSNKKSTFFQSPRRFSMISRPGPSNLHFFTFFTICFTLFQGFRSFPRPSRKGAKALEKCLKIYSKSLKRKNVKKLRKCKKEAPGLENHCKTTRALEKCGSLLEKTRHSHDTAQGEGGEQGDPLMPALYALAQQPALHDVQAALREGESHLCVSRRHLHHRRAGASAGTLRVLPCCTLGTCAG